MGRLDLCSVNLRVVCGSLGDFICRKGSIPDLWPARPGYTNARTAPGSRTPKKAGAPFKVFSNQRDRSHANSPRMKCNACHALCDSNAVVDPISTHLLATTGVSLQLEL